MSVKVAQSLIALGCAPHQAINILGWNSTQWFFAAMGGIFAGLTPAGIYITNAPDAVAYVLNLVKTKWFYQFLSIFCLIFLLLSIFDQFLPKLIKIDQKLIKIDQKMIKNWSGTNFFINFWSIFDHFLSILAKID